MKALSTRLRDFLGNFLYLGAVRTIVAIFPTLSESID